jgi:hypothetical protein
MERGYLLLFKCGAGPHTDIPGFCSDRCSPETLPTGAKLCGRHDNQLA